MNRLCFGILLRIISYLGRTRVRLGMWGRQFKFVETN